VHTKTVAAGLVLGSLAVSLGAPTATASGPVMDSGSISGFVFVTDCGDFEIWDDFETFFSAKVFLDAEGSASRVVEHIWGSDTFVNTTTGASVSGTFNNGEIVDLSESSVNQNGTNGLITLPGVGLVFIDVGRYVFNFETSEFTFLSGKHGFIDEDYTKLCEVLS
jgi:hypothetical protein